MPTIDPTTSAYGPVLHVDQAIGNVGIHAQIQLSNGTPFSPGGAGPLTMQDFYDALTAFCSAIDATAGGTGEWSVDISEDVTFTATVAHGGS